MQTMKFFEGCAALVTGASAGLGAEFARQLAPYARRLVLVARRNELLEELAGDLRRIHPHLDVRVYSADLAAADRRQALADWLLAENIAIDFLVNNAGLGDRGPFHSGDWTRIQSMLDTNITALTHLTHLLVNRMIVQGRAAILNVSSVAGFFPLPQMSVYSATKAYVTSFSESLAMELRPLGITVTALCPGPVPTEFSEVATRDGEADFASQYEVVPALVSSPSEVVRVGLDAVARDRARVIPNPLLAVTVAIALAIPFFIVRHILASRATNFRSST
jgi:short-subunit dehydrogenase